ncbi:hypothetical protein O181_113897 [Austropuccinia psidii MF-1]|uniref:Uncharacterized protein n=1 Tax=Austropuccinia psidii MF-1 TaxID=1389203 RepID=A0A9Q3K4L9_9BASI|nr:hypothetical protein [Austropuccinia psidii MF-1]
MKQHLDEDPDSTLRLNMTSGLNFISRRPILAALSKGHLFIEPIWSAHKLSFEKCTLYSCCLNPWLPTKLNNPPNLTSTSSHDLDQQNLTLLSDHFNLSSINPTPASSLIAPTTSTSTPTSSSIPSGGKISKSCWSGGNLTKSKTSSSQTLI